jgi:hypothetical protein
MIPDASMGLVEETDRYEQALLLKDLAQACFAEAKVLCDSSNSKGAPNL